jgi:hypothetical protein
LTTSVEQVYRDLLDREAEPAGLAFWVQVAGTSGLPAVVNGIEHSTEFHSAEVQFLYEKLLRRAADPFGVASWTSFLNNGGTYRQLEADLLGSNEYFARFGKSSTTGYLSQLYEDVLGRAVDPSALAGWGHVLTQSASGNTVQARAEVAFGILASVESNTVEIQSYFEQFLGRVADPSGLSSFLSALQSSVPEEVVIAAILGSGEYATRATNELGAPINPNFYTPAVLAGNAPGSPGIAGFLFP